MSESTEQDEIGVYAILRWDGFHGRDASPEVLVTVKEIVHNLEVAEAEVDRLNELAEGKDYHYFWQYTRLRLAPAKGTCESR